jgi:transcription factor E2F7/8
MTFTQYDGMNGVSASFFEANDSKYNRKEKSLGELCRRFLSIYGKEEKDLLLLDQCTRELGVERRRIYDIINILESFCVIRRQAKNSYLWRGIDRIVHSIKDQIVSNAFIIDTLSPENILNCFAIKFRII